MVIRRGRGPASVALALSGLLVLGGALAACTADPLAEQYRAGDNKGFIAADGLETVEIPPEQRSAPLEFTGVSDTGETITSEDFRGQVLVVNFWYAACGPCIVEAPELEAAYREVGGPDVAFLGINTADQAATARSFAKDNGISYPSLISVGDRELKLAFAEATPLNATPVTLVVDPDGRVAARVIGAVSDASILTTLVKDTLAENG
jgi:peroxiredoxin